MKAAELNLHLNPVLSSTTAPVALTVIEDEQSYEAKNHESSPCPSTSTIFTMIKGTLIICSMVALIQRVGEALIYVWDSNINNLEVLMEMDKISCYEAPQWFIVTQIAGEDDASLMPLWELEWRDIIEYTFGELAATIMVFNSGICENFAAYYVVESPCGGGLVYTWLSLILTIDGELGVSKSALGVKNILVVEIIIFIFDPGGGSSLEYKWIEFIDNFEDKVVLMKRSIDMN
ncbi:uncharacterized protein G2W53_001984 [Senna tora]|uniref:Uncharacterized protein n=1 Tax=Senna tora TaxID=362788 RepID=A0A834XGY9_9FABA|nr:uncharacterized protein G2W53_001984 [Senna tora]